jgi:hypothetical protein
MQILSRNATTGVNTAANRGLTCGDSKTCGDRKRRPAKAARHLAVPVYRDTSVRQKSFKIVQSKTGRKALRAANMLLAMAVGG